MDPLMKHFQQPKLLRFGTGSDIAVFTRKVFQTKSLNKWNGGDQSIIYHADAQISRHGSFIAANPDSASHHFGLFLSREC